MIYKRKLPVPDQAFFLFGARGTGKSTFLTENFSHSIRIDLLRNSEYLQYLKDPSLLEKVALAIPSKQWLVIDEVQKIPALLDEVQNLIENHRIKKIILSGSSARKLRRDSGNLLAGRALVKYLYPLTCQELNFDIPLDVLLKYGSLPMSVIQNSVHSKEDYLISYVETYLREEIRSEGLVKHLDSFSRFLEIAALCAGQVVNVSGVARDAGVNRNSVRNFFTILEDTLIGQWLPAYRPRAKIKETANPKFFWFDNGMLRAAVDGFNRPTPDDFIGIALETFVFHELRAYLEYSQKRGYLSYWRTPSGAEIDFIVETPKQLIGIEVKAAKNYQSKMSAGLKSFSENKKLTSKWVIYRGDKKLKEDDIFILPVFDFLKMLYSGEVIL